jgi:hypothetical protein
MAVAEDGAPGGLQVIESLAFGLDEKAIELVSKMHFAPTMLNGRPQPAAVQVLVTFHLPAGALRKVQ